MSSVKALLAKAHTSTGKKKRSQRGDTIDYKRNKANALHSSKS